jgi:hypothetical protein
MCTPHHVTTTYRINALDRATLPPSRSKFCTQPFTSDLSHFILKRRRTTVACVAGFRLKVPPTEFLTSEFFGDFLSGINLVGKRMGLRGKDRGDLRPCDSSGRSSECGPRRRGNRQESDHDLRASSLERFPQGKCKRHRKQKQKDSSD